MDRLANEKDSFSYQNWDDANTHLLNVGQDEDNFELKSKRRLKARRIVLVGVCLLLALGLLALSATS
jgi:hypothetical protein